MKLRRISHWWVELEAKKHGDVLSDIAEVEKVSRGLYRATLHGQKGDYICLVPSNYCHSDLYI